MMDIYKQKIKKALSTPYDCYSKYIEHLKMLIESDPQHLHVINQLAIAYLETRQPELSLEMFKHAVSVKPTVQSLNNLGYFYYHEGEPDLSGVWGCQVEKAIICLIKAIEMKPLSHIPYSILGEIYLNIDKSKEAIQVLKKAVHIGKTSLDIFNLGMAYFKITDYNTAQSYFYLAGKRLGDDLCEQWAYYYYGVCMALLGKYEESLKVVNQLVKTKDYDWYLGDEMLADIYYLCDQYQSVIKMYDLTNTCNSIQWISQYFYCLFKLGLKDDLHNLLIKVVKENEEKIEDVLVDETFDKSEREEYLAELTAEIQEYKNAYEAITQKDFKPPINFWTNGLHECGIFGCIRHEIEEYNII